jgi:hypothetical protein
MRERLPDISGFQTRKERTREIKKLKYNIVTETVVRARKKVLKDKMSAGERNGEKPESRVIVVNLVWNGDPVCLARGGCRN